jgi:hypothetical protein
MDLVGLYVGERTLRRLKPEKDSKKERFWQAYTAHGLRLASVSVNLGG